MYFKGYLPSLSNFPYSCVTKAFTLIVCHNCWKFKSRKMLYLLLCKKKKIFFCIIKTEHHNPAVISLIRLEQYFFIFWTLHTHQMFSSQILSHCHGHHFINKEAKACQLRVTGQGPGLELGSLKVSPLGYFCNT